MSLPRIRLKKGEDRRVRFGHPWIFSNEIDTQYASIKAFEPGQEVLVEAADQSLIGVAYFNPYSLIAARIFSHNPNDRLDTEFFLNKFKLANSLRVRLFSKPFYRFIFGESDQLPGLVLDRYGTHFVVQINTAGMELQRAYIINALLLLFPDTSSILYRNDSAVRKYEGLEAYVKPAFGNPPEELILEENEVRFSLPFSQGQKTGWFYDQRINRAALKKYAKNCHVLDVFSYVGGFGIQAAVFGAKQVDFIEASELACQYIQKNSQLNDVAKKINIIQNNAFEALKNLLQEGKCYDLIILDPPAFIKKQKDRKEGLIAYQRLNELALKLLSTDGILISCSCSMHLEMSDLIQLLQRAALRTKQQIQILERGHQGPDHPLHPCIPETDYLKSLILRTTKE